MLAGQSVCINCLPSKTRLHRVSWTAQENEVIPKSERITRKQTFEELDPMELTVFIKAWCQE